MAKFTGKMRIARNIDYLVNEFFFCDPQFLIWSILMYVTLHSMQMTSELKRNEVNKKGRL